MASPLITSLPALFTAVAKSVDTYFKTRQQSYNRSMDKKKSKAIRAADLMRDRIIELGIKDKDLRKHMKSFQDHNN